MQENISRKQSFHITSVKGFFVEIAALSLAMTGIANSKLNAMTENWRAMVAPTMIAWLL